MLSLEDVSIRLGTRTVVSGIDARMQAGDAVAVIGPNGAGKTTLMRSVVGLVKPVGGSVSVAGRDPRDARSSVAYVQQVTAFDSEFPVTAMDVVLMGRYRSAGWFRRPSRKDKAIAAESLEQVGMTAFGSHRFGKLSGGQRQRVLLARAMAQQAPLLLMDEPFNGVDATTVDVCLEVLAKLRDEGTSILISTHDMDVARRLCNKVLLMNNTQFGFGPTAQVLVHTLLHEAFGSKSAAFHDHHGIVTTQ